MTFHRTLAPFSTDRTTLEVLSATHTHKVSVLISGWFREFQISGFSACGDEEDWEERTAFFLLPCKSNKQRPVCTEETLEVQSILIIHGS